MKNIRKSIFNTNLAQRIIGAGIKSSTYQNKVRLKLSKHLVNKGFINVNILVVPNSMFGVFELFVRVSEEIDVDLVLVEGYVDEERVRVVVMKVSLEIGGGAREEVAIFETVDANEESILVIPQYLLGPIPLVHIPIQDGYLHPWSQMLKMPGCHHHIVVITEP